MTRQLFRLVLKVQNKKHSTKHKIYKSHKRGKQIRHDKRYHNQGQREDGAIYARTPEVIGYEDTTGKNEVRVKVIKENDRQEVKLETQETH